jgi:hypothetical protein
LLAGLPPDVAETAEARSLDRVAGALADDVVPTAELRRNLRANLEALGVRAHGLGEWAGRDEPPGGACVCRATDGNVVWRAGGGKPWQLVGDYLKAAVEIGRKAAGAEVGAPLYVEGLLPPWVARDVLSKRGRQADGHCPRTVLVHRGVGECVVALSVAEMSGSLGSPGVHLYAGENATRELSADLLARVDLDVSGAVLVLTPPSAAGASRGCRRWCGKRKGRRRRRQRSCARGVEGKYGRRDRAWWAARYRAALGGGEPLRVLLPTTRYTTFLRHAAEDLARALEGRGCRTRVLMEPDTASKARGAGVSEGVRGV